ncbi:MAG: intercellular adhesin biosynthesis polysaccharide N-deacetylase, partial [Tetragenococcus sp.]|nr:intercellular adhesin biosynthesis polysaccharide N-deacetylase [Tetragenococcus sp.]
MQSKIRLTIFVMLSILTLSSIGVEAKEKQTETNERLEYEENSVLALNYHRVRDVTWLDRFLLFFSNPYELKRYSVST